MVRRMNQSVFVNHIIAGRAFLPGTTIFHNQILCPAAVRSENKISDPGKTGSGNQRCGSAISEKRTIPLVLLMNILAVCLRCQKQDMICRLGFQQPCRKGKSIGVTGTAEIEIQSSRLYRNAKPVLDDAGACRQKIIRALGAK